ncbi:transcription factor Ouib [Drosophila tropicalis]|uniref:transcription factor Ouib n=1 Tax=Drosophila tropicalis TaxID=46794 RepID=UPI0035AB7981
MNLNEVCRICANQIRDKKRQKNVFSHKRLLNQLQLITGVVLTLEDDGLPKFICERCQSELDLAVKFRERCIFSQRYLKEMLEKECERGETEFVELDVTDAPMIELDDEQLMFEEEGVLIELDQNFEDEEGQSFNEDLVEEDEDDEEEDEIDPEASVMAAAEAAYVADLEEQQSRGAAKSRQQFFICDECGHLSVNPNSYSEHLRAHADRKTMKRFYPCNDCKRTFTTKAKLENHRLQSHSSLRIFKCSTCGETFAAYGDRQRHQKTHANERPYPCLECEMVFRSVKQLKLHSASHDSPPYRCIPCGREFPIRLHWHSHKKVGPTESWYLGPIESRK